MTILLGVIIVWCLILAGAIGVQAREITDLRKALALFTRPPATPECLDCPFPAKVQQLAAQLRQHWQQDDESWMEKGVGR